VPVEIIAKKKTEPLRPSQHAALVPLRVVDIVGAPQNLSVTREVEAYDIIFTMPNYGRCIELFNCTRGHIIDRRFNEYLRCIRAYDIRQVVLSNDDEPAPAV
jgi:hypothetical protein